MVVGGVSIPVVDEGKTRQEKPTPKEEARLRRECYRLLQEMNVNLQEMNDKVQRLVEQKQVSEKNDQWLDDEQRKYECDCGSLSLDQAQCSAVEITAEVAAEHTTSVAEAKTASARSADATINSYAVGNSNESNTITTSACGVRTSIGCFHETACQLQQLAAVHSSVNVRAPTADSRAAIAAVFPFDPGGQWAIFDPGGQYRIHPSRSPVAIDHTATRPVEEVWPAVGWSKAPTTRR